MKISTCGFLTAICVAIAASCSVIAAEGLTVSSPDGKIEVKVSAGQSLTYSVRADKKTVLSDSSLKLVVKSMRPLGPKFEVEEAQRRSVDETWKPLFGNYRQIPDRYNELRLKLKETAIPHRRFDLIFRVFDDGVAFRYFLPRQTRMESFVLMRELSQFAFAKDHTAWMADYEKFVSHQEAEFPKKPLSSITKDSCIGSPLLVKIDDDLYAAVAEAALVDWAGMYLCADSPQPQGGGVTLTSKLSPILGAEVRTNTPHNSPWRVIMIGRRPGDLIESEIILTLNQPCAIKDPSWIKPGKMIWDHWWSGDVKMDTETLKTYIQFAGEMGFPYQLVDWHWYGEPGKSDCTTPAPQVDMPELLKFAKQRNVRLWLWINWEDAARLYEKAFPLYEKWGVAGVKIDFMQRDDQEMVNWYHKIVKKAAKHHLMVNFHGAYKPTGFSRTYPNLITREGVLGNEFNKWSQRVTPEHMVTLPFTRMLIGQMDFTPGGFLNCTRDGFKTKEPPARVMGTRCHQLAMFVVYESPLCCICDHPDNYRGQPGLDFLKIVPTVWDDTKVLGGAPGEYVSIVRQSGKNWFLGAMTNWDPRELKVPLDFLGQGTYTATIYRDAPDCDKNAQHLVVEKRTVKPTDTLTIKLAPGGGVAVRFAPQTN